MAGNSNTAAESGRASAQAGVYPQLLLDNQLCFPLYVCSKEIVRRYKPYLDPLGITYTQYITMMALWERDDVTVHELGGRLYLDSGTLTPLLKKLEEKGLITRTRSAQDERRVIIALTPEGHALRERAAGVPRAMGQCLQISGEDAAALVQLLRKMLEQMKS